jgi:hypothetical protein
MFSKNILKIKNKIILAFFILLCLIFETVPVKAEWEELYNISENGIYPSMMLEADQQNKGSIIHLSYYDNEKKELKYARVKNNAVDAVWLMDSNNVGKYNSINVDSKGALHISYYDDAHGNLKYIYCSIYKIIIDTIDGNNETDVGLYTSIAIDSNNYPQISYYDKTNGDLKYIVNTGEEWKVTVVDEEGDVGKYSSIALDSNNFPHISYYDETNGALKYASFDGSAWKVITVDSSRRAGEFSSLAVDSKDQPHIAYYDNRFKKLKYAVFDGIGWRTQFVLSHLADLFAAYGSYCSIKLDSKDQPHISYYNETLAKVQYTQLDGSRWTMETPYNFIYSGPYNCLALDATDNPYIAIFTSIEKPTLSE